jgi:two-component system, response regulator RegA
LSAPLPKPVVLVVDDDEAFRSRLCRAFTTRGWEVHDAPDGPTALRLSAERRPCLVIVDLRLPGMGGLDIIRELHQQDPAACIIMLTGYGSIPTAITATRLGAAHYLSKPADADQIIEAYHQVVSANPPPLTAPPTSTVPSLARVEWEHIQRVLADCDGNISQAAKLLGLHRRSLQRKLSKHPPRI